jgi:hypothetical protein
MGQVPGEIHVRKTLKFTFLMLGIYRVQNILIGARIASGWTK